MGHSIDMEKVIKGLQCIIDGTVRCESCGYAIDKHGHHSCQQNCASDAIAMMKEQEARELTIDEWREWKENPKRNPICELWENDTSPMWILNPDNVHEPALLMGKLKLFTGKPTLEQCKEVKWDECVK